MMLEGISTKKVLSASLIAAVLCIGTFTSAYASGKYLRTASLKLSHGIGCVYVQGETRAYEHVESIGVELTLYRQNESGSWSEIWSNSKTAHFSDMVRYSKEKVPVANGYSYKLRTKHFVKNESHIEVKAGEKTLCKQMRMHKRRRCAPLNRKKAHRKIFYRKRSGVIDRQTLDSWMCFKKF